MPAVDRNMSAPNTMKTKFIALSFLSALATTGIVSGEADPQSPAEMTATRCLICHGDNQAGQQRLAPPFAMVKMHYGDLDEEKFIKTVSAWVKEPDKNKSKMPGAINHFGLMPSLPYPGADVAIIAKYLFETDFKMPGQGGGKMGKGMGRGNGMGRENQGGGACGQCGGAGCKAGCAGEAKAEAKKAGGCDSCKASKADPEVATNKKWPIPAAMMTHLQSMENDIAAFNDKTPRDHAALAKDIGENLAQLISSCTMEGEAHDALHDWLMPFRELSAQHSKSTDPAVQLEKIQAMRIAFTAFHKQFKPAPQP